MVPMCWGGVAGYGIHVLGWSSWLWYPCVPMCWGGVAGYSTHVLGWSIAAWLWYQCVRVESI